MNRQEQIEEMAKDSFYIHHFPGQYKSNLSWETCSQDVRDWHHNNAIGLIAKGYARSTPLVATKVDGNTSDGYHTFNELYNHRCLLWINYCLQDINGCYLVENHSDGWFLLGKETTQGQISYHCSNKYIHLVTNIERRCPAFDGHTSSIVLVRLQDIASITRDKNPTTVARIPSEKAIEDVLYKESIKGINKDGDKIASIPCGNFDIIAGEIRKLCEELNKGEQNV